MYNFDENEKTLEDFLDYVDYLDDYAEEEYIFEDDEEGEDDEE